jgi:hypothetical protein
MFLPPLEEYMATGYVARVPTLMVSLALGTGSLLSLMCGVILGSMRTQSRQTYELFATLLNDADRGRGSADDAA